MFLHFLGPLLRTRVSEATRSLTSIIAPRLNDLSYSELRRIFGRTRHFVATFTSLYHVREIPTSTFSLPSPGIC